MAETSSERLDATCSHGTCERRGTYELPGRCVNCGWTGTVKYTKGHTSDRCTCHECGCNTVMPNVGTRW